MIQSVEILPHIFQLFEHLPIERVDMVDHTVVGRRGAPQFAFGSVDTRANLSAAQERMLRYLLIEKGIYAVEVVSESLFVDLIRIVRRNEADLQ